MKKRKFAEIVGMVMVLLVGLCSGAWAGPREDVVNYAWDIYNYEWSTSNTILRYSAETSPSTVTGTIRGVPYTDGTMLSFAEYKDLTTAQKEAKYSQNSMQYGMVCATLVTDCIRQGFPSKNLPLLHGVMFHKSRYSGAYTELISSVSDAVFNYDHTQAQWKNIWANIRTSQANSDYPAYQRLKKGDYLNNWYHVILVIDNDTSAQTITYIDQTSCWDYVSNGMVGTHKGTYTYKRLSEHTRKKYNDDGSYDYIEDPYVPMYVDYPNDVPSGIKISDTFPDPLFREYVSYWDINNDGYFSDDEIDNVKDFGDYGGPHPYNYWEGAWGGWEPKGVLELNVGTNHWKGIKNIEGVKIFRNLEVLYVHNDSITGTVDISGLTKLKDFRCFNENRNGGITSINAEGCSSLEQIQCRGNNVTSINRNGCNALTYIDIYNDTAPTIITESLPDAYVGIPYYARVDTIGTTPITYAIKSAVPASNGFNLGGYTNGIINGTPGYVMGTPTNRTPPYTVNIPVTASNHMGADTKTFAVTVRETPIAPRITTTSLPDAYVNEPYYAQLHTTGTEPITYSYNSVAYEQGFRLDGKSNIDVITNGIVDGTPTNPRSYSLPYTVNIKITATNAGGSDTKTFTVTVKERPIAPTITTTSLPDGYVGETYSATLSATGTTPITWDASGLPSGLSCGFSVAQITGTPTKAGTYTVKITASNLAQGTSKTFSLTIKERAVSPSITSWNFPDGYVGESYSGSFTASGTAPITYSISAAGTASGFSCNSSTGEVTGRPNTTGTFSFTIYADNSAGGAGRNVTITIKERAVIPLINTTSLPDGYVGRAYSAQISATGTAPITYSASGLPSGLSCNSSTGYITGIPTSAGIYTINITAVNAVSRATRNITLNIATSGGGTIDPNNEVKPQFKTFSIMMQGQIGINFYVDLPNIDGVTYTSKNCWVEFDIRGDKSNVPQEYDSNFYSKASDGTKYYGFRCYINAAQMADTITATLHYGNNKTVTKEYSAKTYLNTALGISGFSQIVKNLMIAIKNYGHYVQPMLSKTHGWTIGDKYLFMEAHNELTDEDIRVAREAVKSFAFSKELNLSCITVSYSLTFGAETTINLYITPAIWYSGSVAAYLDGGTENLAVKLSNGQYRVQISNISARKLGETHTVKIYSDNNSTVKISALSYVDAVLNANVSQIGKVDIDTMRKAVTALYQYYIAAKAYADTK